MGLEGTWESPCLRERREITSDKLRVAYDGNRFEAIYEVFRGEACDEKVIEVRNRGTYVVRGNEIDYTTTNTRYAVSLAEGARMASRQKTCGIDDWKPGELRDVSATDCRNTGLVGHRRHDIVKVEGDRLHLGTVPHGAVHWDKVGRTPAERPHEYLPEAFIRQ